MTNYQSDPIEKTLEEFDLATFNLAVHPTLENALKANALSLKWIELLSINGTKNKTTPEQVMHYQRDIRGCMEVLGVIQRHLQHQEQREWDAERLKKERRPSSHVGYYITQMRVRMDLAGQLIDRSQFY